jgi:DNA protecting protein DprA
MSILDLVTAILHVSAQKHGRWIPPPDPAGFHALVDPGWSSSAFFREGGSTGLCWCGFDAQDWRDLVFTLLPALPEVFPAILRQDPASVAESCHKYFSRMIDFGFSYLGIWDPSYPAILREIPDPPLGLSLAGDASALQSNCVSVVGSRCAATWALEWSAEFGKLAVKSGISVVSGGAWGCDTAVHCGMLSASFDNVAAVAIQAGGLSRLYPRHNDRLFADILSSGGCLLSERAVDASCRPRDFLVRNRIVAGLSMVTIVVQAAERSGAMVTARLAAMQGRDVWVVKPPLEDVRAAGNLILIGDGATVVENPADAIARFVDLPSWG